jgi:hypothetical protein
MCVALKTVRLMYTAQIIKSYSISVLFITLDNACSMARTISFGYLPRPMLKGTLNPAETSVRPPLDATGSLQNRKPIFFIT